MNKWFSTTELIGFPALPSTKFGLVKKARRENWLSRPRQGRGGGFEYALESLPIETQKALLERELEADRAGQAGKNEAEKLKLRDETEKSVVAERLQKSLMKSEGLKEPEKTRMNAKLEILKMYEGFLSKSKDSATLAKSLFCKTYNTRNIQIREWVEKTIPAISPGSLQRWIKSFKREGITRLAGNYGQKRGSGIIDQNSDLKTFIIGMIADKPDCNPKHIFFGIQARFADADFNLPSYRTVLRWVENWKAENRQLYTSLRNPDEFKSRYSTAFGNSAENITEYNQLWEMDSTPGDIMLADGRHTIIGVIDVYCRRMRLLVSKTSKSSAIAALIRRAMIAWGVPKTIKTDNGSDYTSHYITMTLSNLGIEQKLCPPFSPEKKPFIERGLGTFSHSLLELVPGFIGHNVAERKAIEERKSFAQRLMKKGEVLKADFLSSRQLQEFCDKWTEGFYFMKVHSSLGKSPCEVVSSWAEPIRRITNLRALDALLAPVPGNAGKRIVAKKGIPVDDRYYNAPELTELIGDSVHVRYDLTDAGMISVYTPDMEYICSAECPELLGISREELAVKAKAIHKKRIAAKRDEIKRISRSAAVKGIENEILDHYSKQGSKITIDSKSQDYSTSALEAAAVAAEMSDERAEPTFEEINSAGSVPVNPEVQKKVAEIIRLDLWREQAGNPEEIEKEQRFKRYDTLFAMNFQGISEEDDRWRKNWETTSEYFAWKMTRKLKEEIRRASGSNT